MSNGDSVRLNEGNEWAATLNNLPVYQSGVEIVYTCRDYSGELRPQPDEVDELRWFAADALPDEFSPTVRRQLRDWAEKKLNGG